MLSAVQTLLVGDRVSSIAEGGPAGGLWVPLSALAESTGWELKPEGACLGDICVPLPSDRREDFVHGEWFGFGALAGYLSMPVARDEETDTWCVGESAEYRRLALDTLEAPNFTLPDHLGGEHQLTDYRGKKVFLVSWASW